jgi:CPA2 family monovalent cation:H+ antiporter-2
MQIATFLQDLAIIMIVAGIVTVIFHQLKQPVVLGYILSGVILGRHTPPFSFIHDENTVKTLAELGVVFLMFSLGLEFSIRKLVRVGSAALITALAEIVLMIFVGYEIGQLFGWKRIDAFFLGAMLAISSTTIIVKALNELGMKREDFAQLIFGILIIEDILAIGILVILSSTAIGGSVDPGSLMLTLGKLFIFLVVSLIIGFLTIPKILAYVAQFKSREMLLVTVLGFCFGFCLLVIKLGYSVALGAFLIGAIMAEAHEIKLIEKLVEPLTNMFSAIFFVSIGLLVDPQIMQTYWLPIVVITLALIIGKVLVCSLSVFLAGRDGRTSMRVGMGLAQIGEFSFIIASLGISLKVMSPYLYPIIVAISAITTFLTPYLIKIADPLTVFLARIMPSRIATFFNTYTAWIQSMSIPPDNEKALIQQALKKGLIQVFLNLTLIIAIFIFGSYLAHNNAIDLLFKNDRIENAIIWGISLVVSLPFLIAVYRKLKGLI